MEYASRVLSRPLLAALGATVLTSLVAPASAAAQASATTAATEVEQVIVTARRRAENIQDTPVAVTAISASQLEAAASPNIQDLEGLTPNLIIDANNVSPNSASIAIRGISFEDIEKSFDPAVGVLLDGVYLGTNNGALLNFFDFSSVEVLRGPQGTLFGRNTTGGVINVRRTRPTGEFGVRARALFGNYGREDYRLVVNAPIIADKVAGKAFYFSSNFDGFLNNVTTNRREGRQKSESFGASLLLTPSQAIDLLITAEHGHDGGQVVVSPYNRSTDLICLQLPLGPGGSLIRPTGISAAECTPRQPKDLYTAFANRSNATSLTRKALTAEANWRLDWTTLTSVTGYIKTNEDVNWDVDGTSIDFFTTRRSQRYYQFSQEFRAAGDLTDGIDYVAGIYYFYNQYQLLQPTQLGPFLGNRTTTQLARYNSQSYAAFADVDWKITDALRLSVGGRYTSDRKKLDNSFVGGFHTIGSKSWGEFTPRVSLDYRVSPDMLAYASFARGYRSGGFNGRSSTPVSSTTPYEPETVDSFEVGLKSSFFDHRLIFNVAAFATDYKNKQEETVVPTPGGATAQETIVTNAASAKIKGLEFDATARPVPNLTLRASLGLLDAKYDKFPSRSAIGAPIDLSTLTLRRTPDVTGSISGDYTIPTSVGAFTLSGQYRYIASYQTTLSRAPGVIPFVNDPRGLTDPQNNVEASLAWSREVQGGKLTAQVFGRNLLNDKGLSSALPVAGLFTFGSVRPPRTYGIEIGFEY